jgi:hypothetical protein
LTSNTTLLFAAVQFASSAARWTNLTSATFSQPLTVAPVRAEMMACFCAPKLLPTQNVMFFFCVLSHLMSVPPAPFV